MAKKKRKQIIGGISTAGRGAVRASKRRRLSRRTAPSTGQDIKEQRGSDELRDFLPPPIKKRKKKGR